jgi:hypothetical protein
MIDLFRTWLPQIIGYAEAIQDGTLQRAWADSDRSRTSAYYSGELYEQVFGDLDSDSMLADARAALRAHPMVAEALERFLASLKRLDAWIEAHVDTSLKRVIRPNCLCPLSTRCGYSGHSPCCSRGGRVAAGAVSAPRRRWRWPVLEPCPSSDRAPQRG